MIRRKKRKELISFLSSQNLFFFYLPSCIEYISAGDVVTYFSAPIVAGLVGYFGKAAVENVQKISGSNKLKLGELASASSDTSSKIAKG